jgi:hypothetical protein
MEVRGKEKGQAMVETAVILSIVLLTILGLVDPVVRAVNVGMAFYYTFKAAREASIFIADGTHTCDQMARNAAFGPAGAPILMMVDTSDPTAWSLTISPCPNDPSWSPSSGVSVKATFTFVEKTIWWTGPWNGSVSHSDVFQ